MESVIKFFDRKIIEMVSIFIGIYIVLYLLKIDVYLITTIILFGLYFYYRYDERVKEKEIISYMYTKHVYLILIHNFLNIL